MARNWEATRERVRQWHALVERCKVTLRDAQPLMSRAEAVHVLREAHSELQSDREAGNALDYAYGRKGGKR